MQRTVVLSIVGVDKVAGGGELGTGFDGYCRAKYQQEQVTLAEAAGARIVRSTQFDDIFRQAIGWPSVGPGSVEGRQKLGRVSVSRPG